MTWGRGAVALALLASLAAGCSDAGTTAGPAPADSSPQSAEPLRVLLAGDSITVGYYATEPDQSYAALLLDELGADRMVEAVRAEEAGARAWRIANLVDDLAPTDLDVAVVEVGANDVGKTSVKGYAAEVAALVDRLDDDSPDVVTVCLGPWNEPLVSRPYDRAVERICDSDGRRYVRVSDLYAAAGMRGPVGAPTSYGPRDDFHPNDPAHAEIARRILAVVENAP